MILKFLSTALIVALIISNPKPIYMKGKGYTGYIFDETHFVFHTIKNQQKRITPTNEEIALAEKLINIQLLGLNKSLLNQGKDCPIIHKKLKNYIRQYVGYINIKGEKVIWINMLWNRDKEVNDNLSKDVVFVNDGCSYYWSVEVNLSNQIVYNLQINGSS